MTSFLLAISFLLNGIAIFAVIILYLRQNRLKEVEKNQENMVKEMEEVISSYLFEMKEENEAFIKQFKLIRADTSSLQWQKNNGEITNKKLQTAESIDIQNDNKDLLIKDKEEDTETEWNGKVGVVLQKQAAKAYKSAVKYKKEISPISLSNAAEDSGLSDDTVHTENNHEEIIMPHDDVYRDIFLNQVKLLQKQGMSTEEIAKKMNRGKTEIELLLKFS